MRYVSKDFVNFFSWVVKTILCSLVIWFGYTIGTQGTGLPYFDPQQMVCVVFTLRFLYVIVIRYGGV